MYDIKPDFIIWTGDNPAHNVWENTKEEAIKITTLFSYMVQFKYNYSIPVYPAIGIYSFIE